MGAPLLLEQMPVVEKEYKRNWYIIPPTIFCLNNPRASGIHAGFEALNRRETTTSRRGIIRRKYGPSKNLIGQDCPK
jgi:hypothetical protein